MNTHLDPSVPCVLWKGTVSDDGYGKIEVNGKQWRASRWVWTNTFGFIPEGYIICHTCDVPLCVEVRHLWLGTYKENMQDCLRKGRFGKARFTPDVVLEIRDLYATGDHSHRSLAKLFDCDHAIITRLLNKTSYSHVA